MRYFLRLDTIYVIFCLSSHIIESFSLIAKNKNPKSLTLLNDFRILLILFTKIESPKIKSILSS